MKHNLLVTGVAALIPLLVGFVWYGPFLFRNAWMAATGVTMDEKPNSSKMIMNMVLLYIFSFFVANGLMPVVIHQLGLFSMLADDHSREMLKDPNSDLYKLVSNLWAGHGHMFRRYRHGAFHGALTAIFFALPLISTSAIFEKRSVKYVLITWGFWLVNFMLMGALICHWAYVDWPK